MEFMEIDQSSAMIAQGAATGMGLDSDGNVFYVLQVAGLKHTGEEVNVQIVIPPLVTDQFLKVVNSIGAKSE